MKRRKGTQQRKSVNAYIYSEQQIENWIYERNKNNKAETTTTTFVWQINYEKSLVQSATT